MSEVALTQAALLSILRYEPETGKFYWLSRRAQHVYAGSQAGSLRKGYRVIVIEGRAYPAHRLAWLYVHGRFPEYLIDHINRSKDDNRITNLRECSQAENMRNCGKHSNNTSGFKGVSKTGNYWRARARINGQPVLLGTYRTPEQAASAYNEFCREHYGQFHQEECLA